jgi:hypothetical protein
MTELTVTNDLHFRRVAKSGKVTTRSALGVITSGNRAEGVQLGDAIVRKLITNNTYAPIMVEMVRVFAPSVLIKHGVFKLGEDYAICDSATKTISYIDGNWTAATAAAYCQAVQAYEQTREAAGKSLTGEKQAYATWAGDLVSHVASKERAKIEQAGQLRRAA